MTDRELMQQALDALERAISDDRPYIVECKASAEALRARLAQPEPEPLEYWNAVEGWVKLNEVHQHFDSVGCGTIYKNAGEDRVPLYTAPPQREWQGLTDEEVEEVAKSVGYNPLAMTVYEYRVAVQKATEAKLKEKNELATR